MENYHVMVSLQRKEAGERERARERVREGEGDRNEAQCNPDKNIL